MHGTTINELAERLNVSTKTLIKWEEYFSIDVDKDDNGNRSYTKDTIKVFQDIKNLVTDINLSTYPCAAKPDSQFQDEVDQDKNHKKFELVTKPFSNQLEKSQAMLESINIEKSKLLAEIEILEYRNREIVASKDRLIDTLEFQLKEYKDLLNLKDKAIKQLENHLTEYFTLKQNKKWWEFWK